MLEACNLTIQYGPRVAVWQVSLQIRPGEITAIIGPNGAGKSTLLRALNGSLSPAAGEILLDGKPLRSFSRRAIARQIAVVAQDADIRFPVSVLEFVLGGRYAWASTGAWGWETDHDLQIGGKLLRETELWNLSGRLLTELSGGERQRAVLARALVTEAAVLLLDEPTANLDLAHQAATLALVRTRCDKRKLSAVVITHDMNLASEFADYVLLMSDGRTVAVGRPKEVLKAQLLEAVFAIRVLVDAHPITGMPRITPVHETRR